MRNSKLLGLFMTLVVCLFLARSGPDAQGSETGPSRLHQMHQLAEAYGGSVSLFSSDDVESAPGPQEEDTFVYTIPSWDHAGLTIVVGSVGVRYVDPMTSGPPFHMSGEVASMRWNSNGEKITISVERRPNQSMNSFMMSFRQEINLAIRLYPPTTSSSLVSSQLPLFLNDESIPQLSWEERETIHLFLDHMQPTVQKLESQTGTQGGTMSISWKHDPDGAGPLKTMTPTASVEIEKGESAGHAARRLKVMVEAMMEVFPPNV